MGRTQAIGRLMRRSKSSAAGDETPKSSAVPEGPAPDAGDVAASGTGDSSDGFDLEVGIASIFETIRSGGAEAADGERPEDNGATHDLLLRLNQLWLGDSPGGA